MNDLDAVDSLLSGIGRLVRAGVDRVEIDAFQRVLETGGDRFMETVYTDAERGYCDGRVERYATRFAAKEATTKALGTGIRGLGLGEIEIVSRENGEPLLKLHGRALDRARALGISSISVSLTHTSEMAEAFVIAVVDSGAGQSFGRKESRE
jgi:holo-[acyl-carrier protein] synthase